VDAAARTAAAVTRHRPAAILHVGIAGARRDAGLALADVVIGSEAVYCDLGVGSDWAPRVVPGSDTLLGAVQRVLPAARTCPIGTSAHLGGSDTLVEAMEGFSVLRVAQLAGVPAIEVRAISNYIGEADRANWRFAEAFDALARVTPRLVEAIAACVK
jgi:futalosine hydrolase